MIFDRAVEADPISPRAPYQAAGILIQFYTQSRTLLDVDILTEAMEYARVAQRRNPAAFKPWRRMSEINLLLSERAGENQRHDYIQAAYDNLHQVALRYPGSGKTHYAMGALAEELGLLDQAIQHYQAAVWIEDLYRQQFKVMYPEQERVISRLGNLSYEDAKKRIEQLGRQLEDEMEEADETMNRI